MPQPKAVGIGALPSGDVVQCARSRRFVGGAVFRPSRAAMPPLVIDDPRPFY
jgi:hypothetical protein